MNKHLFLCALIVSCSAVSQAQSLYLEQAVEALDVERVKTILNEKPFQLSYVQAQQLVYKMQASKYLCRIIKRCRTYDGLNHGNDDVWDLLGFDGS